MFNDDFETEPIEPKTPKTRRYQYNREELTKHRRRQWSKESTSRKPVWMFKGKPKNRYTRKGRRPEQNFGKYGVPTRRLRYDK